MEQTISRLPKEIVEEIDNYIDEESEMSEYNGRKSYLVDIGINLQDYLMEEHSIDVSEKDCVAYVVGRLVS